MNRSQTRCIHDTEHCARLLELPQSLLDRFQYDLPQSILDVLPHPHLANPIALAIHVIHYLLLAPLFPGHNDVGSVLRSAGRAKGRWERFEDEQSVRGRSVASGWTVRRRRLSAAQE